MEPNPDDLEPTPGEPAGAVPRHVFGADAPSQLGPDELLALRRSLSGITGLLSLAWTELLGREVEVALAEVTPGPSGAATIAAANDPDAEEPVDVLAGIGGDGPFSAVGNLGPELGHTAIVVPNLLGLVVVDVLLGGSGRPAGERGLSAIDRELLRAVVPGTLGALRGLVETGATDREPSQIDDLEPVELATLLGAAATAEFHLTLGDGPCPLLVVLSQTAVGALVGGVDSSSVGGVSEAATPRSTLQATLAGVVVEAVVSFPPVTVPSRNVLALSVGDVVALGYSTDELLSLSVDGRKLAEVRPARAGTSLACQVVSAPLRVTPSPSGGTVPSPSSAPGGLS